MPSPCVGRSNASALARHPKTPDQNSNERSREPLIAQPSPDPSYGGTAPQEAAGATRDLYRTLEGKPVGFTAYLVVEILNATSRPAW